MSIYKYTKIGQVPARGGPTAAIKNPGDRFSQTPTTPGRYVISSIAPFLSQRYHYWSGIKWGTPVRFENEVTQIYQHGKWINLSRVNNDRVGVSEQKITEEIRSYHKSLGLTGVPDKWVFGDFGHTTIQYFKDLNGNFKLDGKEHIMGDMIHTTTPDEAATFLKTRFSLAPSHGCVHVRPTDIDMITQQGFAKKGQVFEVHPYAETTFKPTFTRERYGRPNFELHFFPGCTIVDADSPTKKNTGVIIIYEVHKV